MAHGTEAVAGRGLLRRMTSRDPDEDHRAATPLELLYDLCFVVAIAQAAAELHHGLSHGHPISIMGYGLPSPCGG